MNPEEIKKQIELMTEYTKMMLDRKDYHGGWDAMIDLQRLNDKLENKTSSCPVCGYNKL